ncbi:MAG: TPM domain-containing protein [Gemmatimonadales bacterium]|nr:TPM domain-containing protein [Gemmatimonadales bacterium]
MRGTRAKATALLAALQLTAVAAVAQNPEVERLFPAQPSGFVTDVAGVVDPASESRMESLIERLRGATGAEIAVATLPTIGDRSEAEVALAIGRRWGVGASAEIGDQRRNAGAIVLLVPRAGGKPGTGHLRVEVGQGLEGIVTDATAGRVRDLIAAQVGNEQYGPALASGVETLAGIIARGYGVSDTALTNFQPVAPSGGGSRPLGGLLPLLLFALFFLVMSGARGGRRRRRGVYWGGPWIGGGWGGGGGFGGGGFGGGGGGFGGFGGGGGFSGGGAGGRF